MKHIKSFEAKLRDIGIFKDPALIKIANIEYQEDEQLIFTVHISKYNKNIFIKWNNKYNHSIIERIKSRTSFKYTSEFNKLIKNGINTLFNDYFDELDQSGRYALYFEEYHFYLLFDINYQNLFSQYTIINIPTINITTPDPDTCKNIFIISDN